MNTVVVRRRIARQVMMLAGAVFLLLAAFDIIWFHQVSGPPEVDEETGQITSGGLSEQRTDYLWGALFLVAGAGIAAVAVAGLVSRAPVLVADDETLRLRVSGPNGYLSIPWGGVRWLHSGSEGDDDELVPTRVFLVHVDDPSPYPSQLWGAEWDGGTLEVDADSWSMPPEEVAVRCRLALETWRREHPAEVVEPDGAEGPGHTEDAETPPTKEVAVAAIPPDDPGAPEAEPVG